ncbi:D-alanyl-D-alanine carboxypeptidase [Aquabacterium sp.]|uniref:D-alanyl-D-alanine carboxypeptidase/D-alanyl-D-alanine-endopeptidase n=1 Tax=Aquabacterium sp. TaxID=1872578 RepID=UPI0025BB0EF9|nr:D-alanyl-D-alanine carboxypeptidase [Aquabacterium sp.]
MDKNRMLRPPWLGALTLGLLGAPFVARAAEPSPPGALPPPLAAALKASGLPASAVSLLVLPAEDGPPRLAHEADTVRQPASVAKLFTTGAALQRLGPAYTWHTDVALGGPLSADGVLAGPLHLRGGGDPGLVLEQIGLMMARWREAGLKEIQGDLLIDRSAFNVPPHDPTTFDGQGLKPYNAGPDALLLNHQAIVLRLRPDSARPGWAKVSLSPPLDGVTLDAEVVLQGEACGDWRGRLALRTETGPTLNGPSHPAPWTLTLRGAYAPACGERDWPLLWPGGGTDLAERLLPRLWRDAGGTLHGRVRAGDWPATAPVWASWVSPALGPQVRDINKFSNNVMARQLFLTLAQPAMAPGQPPATLAQARELLGQHVREATRDAQGRSPCDGPALVLDNGSGLSRLERSSAACLGRWLQAVWRSPVMPELLASLPVSGVDGTARRLGSVAGRAHLKTGSLDGVASIAGVADGDSGRRWVVVGLINHPQADAARPLLEALVAWALHDAPSPNEGDPVKSAQETR